MNDALGRLYRRVQMAVSSGRITAPPDDSGAVQKAQVRVSDAEVLDGVPVVQLYGLASVPPVGADATVLFVAGDRSNGAVVATGNQGDRVRGQKGREVSLYNGHGMRLHLAESGPVLDCGGKPCTVRNATTVTVVGSERVTLDAPKVEVTGDLDVRGEVTAKAGTFHASTHRHLASGGSGVGGPPQPGS